MYRIFFLLMVLLLSACAVTANNTTNLSAEANQSLASDTAQQLNKEFISTQTKLSFETPNDEFGKSLAEDIRSLGFAVADSDQSVSDALSVTYFVDNVQDNIFRVTVKVNEISFTRGYSITDSQVQPLGTWSKNE